MDGDAVIPAFHRPYCAAAIIGFLAGATCLLTACKGGTMINPRGVDKYPTGGKSPEAGEEARPEVKLSDVGKIKCGAGCVAYHTGEIILTPDGEYVYVAVNAGGYFYTKEGKPIPSFTRRLPAAVVNAFVGDVKRYSEEDRSQPWPSTGAATVDLDLPLDGGRLKGTFGEVRSKGMDYDPLVECIRDFVREQYKEA